MDEQKRAYDRHDRQKKFQILLHGRVMRHRDDSTDCVVYSYRQLRDYLNTMPESLLDHQVEILPPGSASTDDAVMLEPVIGVGTIEEMLHVDGTAVTETRSSQDFNHHPERVVLLSDYNGHSKDGDTAYTLVEDGFVGNKTGKVKPWIERRRCEPSMQTSRTKAFQQKAFAGTDEDLMEEQERLCQEVEKGDAAYLNTILDSIQAELYRRIYRLSPRDRLAKEAGVEKDENEGEE